MKWFQHKSDAYTDLKLQAIIDEFGMEGYGLYWVCCELIAQQGDDYHLNNIEIWLSALKRITRIKEEKVKEIIVKFASLTLICEDSLEKGILYIPKMANYSDDYSKRVRRVSEQSSDNVHVDKIRIDKITLDKINNIYKTFKEKINNGNRLTIKAKLKLKTRLKTFTEQDLLKAIDNFSKDSWWMEHNSNRGVAWFFHSDERIDGLINLKPIEKIINEIK